MKYLLFISCFLSLNLNAQDFKSYYYYEDIYSASNWIEVVKSESTWDAASKTSTDFNYALINALWVKDLKNRTRIIYDASNNILEYTIDLLRSGNYVAFQKSTYTYTGFGKVQEILITNLDTVANVMKNSYKYIYKYDNLNRRTVYQLYSWDASKSAFTNPTGDSISYLNANTYELIEWSWDMMNNNYKNPSFKNLIITNNSGNIVKQTYFMKTTGVWNKASSTTYTLNANFNIQNSVDSTHLTGNAVTRRQSYTYNTSNKLTETIRQQYMGGSFIDEFKQTRSYNGTNDETERINYNYTGGAWNNNRRYRWIYGALGISRNNEIKDLKLYTSEKSIYFINSTLQPFSYTIIDITGKQFYAGVVSGQNETLETSFPTGIYYIIIGNEIRKVFIE